MSARPPLSLPVSQYSFFLPSLSRSLYPFTGAPARRHGLPVLLQVPPPLASTGRLHPSSGQIQHPKFRSIPSPTSVILDSAKSRIAPPLPCFARSFPCLVRLLLRKSTIYHFQYWASQNCHSQDWFRKIATQPVCTLITMPFPLFQCFSFSFPIS